MNELLGEASKLFQTKLRGILALLVVGAYVIGTVFLFRDDSEGLRTLAVMCLAFYFGARSGNGDTR